MKTKDWNFFKSNPEGAIIMALDSREADLLFGAVELHSGEETWLEYEAEFNLDGDVVSLYQETADTPVLEYSANGRRMDLITEPDRLLILWNRGRRTVTMDGRILPPGEITASVPLNVTPWFLRFASWLPKM